MAVLELLLVLAAVVIVIVFACVAGDLGAAIRGELGGRGGRSSGNAGHGRCSRPPAPLPPSSPDVKQADAPRVEAMPTNREKVS